jgi:hypothetical protein
MDLTTQFHATADEIADFLVSEASEHGLTLAAVHFPPYRPEVVASKRLPEVLAENDVIGIVASHAILDLSGRDQLAFIDNNPESLHVQVGKLTGDGLIESRMTVRTSTPALVALWKALFRDFKKITRAGAAIRDAEGVLHRYRDQRHSKAARELAAAGVPMLSLTRKHRFIFDPE